MILQIPDVLAAGELETLRAELRGAAFEDGAATAGPLARQQKRNLQVPQGSTAARKCAPIVVEALRRSSIFFSATLPLRLHGPIFNRYDPGMTYGEHVDNPLMGTTNPVRSDVSATLFLSGPADYDGGELTVQDSLGAHRVKPSAGTIVVYPGNSRHHVAAVSRGTRLAAIVWVQSMVREEAKRRILFELDLSLGTLGQKLPGSPEVEAITATYHNLLRLWAET